MLVNVKYTVYGLERALGLCGLKELKEKQIEALFVFFSNQLYTCTYTCILIMGSLLSICSSLRSSMQFLSLHLECAYREIRFTKPQSAVIISYTLCTMLGHVCSHQTGASTSVLVLESTLSTLLEDAFKHNLIIKHLCLCLYLSNFQY